MEDVNLENWSQWLLFPYLIVKIRHPNQVIKVQPTVIKSVVSSMWHSTLEGELAIILVEDSDLASNKNNFQIDSWRAGRRIKLMNCDGMKACFNWRYLLHFHYLPLRALQNELRGLKAASLMPHHYKQVKRDQFDAQLAIPVINK